LDAQEGPRAFALYRRESSAHRHEAPQNAYRAARPVQALGITRLSTDEKRDLF
jgi:hypothetical protein